MEGLKAPSEKTSKHTAPNKGSQNKVEGKTHAHKHDKSYVPNIEKVPGVHKIVLEELTQKALGCVVGQNVTVEKPWLFVDKEVLLDNIEAHSESSEFLPLRDNIYYYPREQILMGYIPDESKDIEEFYVCVTEESEDLVQRIIEKLKHVQEERLNNALSKKPRSWMTLGSDEEVQCNIYKKNRALYEVEVESAYPILPFEVKFRLRLAQDMRDGYMEKRVTEETGGNVYRTQIDMSIQVAPHLVSEEVQTVCRYPTAAAAQYLLDAFEEMDISEEVMQAAIKFVEENSEAVEDFLQVNGCINFYVNDYKQLKVNPQYETNVSTAIMNEYTSFINMNLSEGKKISGCDYHPMWTGLVALSYVDVAPSVYLAQRNEEDEVMRAVHGKNPALLWSFSDYLNPKLIFESPREVHSLSFCPYNENLLIGGCVNGQVILWDITNRLSKVETEEVLNNDQQRYRSYMHMLMDWMKNIHDLAIVRPTAVSNLKLSHSGCLNTIKWMSPFHKFTKNGKIEEIPEDSDERSLQFLTCGEDGNILIWDMLFRPKILAGGFKPVRPLKRLKRRPSALAVDESPFKVLHLNLRPIYKIRASPEIESNRTLSLASFHISLFTCNYELISGGTGKNEKLSDRLIYRPILCKPEEPIRKLFFAAAMEGDFFEATWEGQDFDSGEEVNFENANFVSCGKYHDGPITSMVYAKETESVLTVGGKVFALWMQSYPNHPVLWRKSKSTYCFGAFSFTEKTHIILNRVDGEFEIWILFFRSGRPYASKLISNGPVNNSKTHYRTLPQNVFGFSDYRGAYRLFYSEAQHENIVQYQIMKLDKLLKDQIKRKKGFKDWQELWNRTYSSLLEFDKDELKELPKKEPAQEDVETSQPAKEPGGKTETTTEKKKYADWSNKAFVEKEEGRIKEIVLKRKQIELELLEKQRKPLQKLEKEKEIKKRKLRKIFKQADAIFKETVGMLFPDVVKEKPRPPPDPYLGGYSEDMKENCYGNFHEISERAEGYVAQNPFEYDFKWNVVMKVGRERRKKLDSTYDRAIHKLRFSTYKAERASRRSSRVDLELPEEPSMSKEDVGPEENMLPEGSEGESF